MPDSIIFAVTGGRDFDDDEIVDREMRRWVRPGDRKAIVIEGGARTGLDRLVRDWCQEHGVHFAEIPALWDYNSRAAGPIRNGVMLLLKPQFVIRFPGGRGTADMCAQAESLGISVRYAIIIENTAKYPSKNPCRICTSSTDARYYCVEHECYLPEGVDSRCPGNLSTES